MVLVVYTWFVFFFKQKTAYEMRISDWSSDVCSSDLLPKMASGEVIGAIAMTKPGGGSDLQAVKTTAIRDGNEFVINGQKTFITNGQNADQIGRASCRERVCQ